MRVDYEYIKNFLELVLECDHVDFKLNQGMFTRYFENEEATNKLVFHLEILEDQGLLKCSSNKIDGIGFTRLGSGEVRISIFPLRLTAQGHQFAADLSKPGVFEQLKTSFKDAGPGEVVKLTFALGKQALDKKMAGLIE